MVEHLNKYRQTDTEFQLSPNETEYVSETATYEEWEAAITAIYGENFIEVTTEFEGGEHSAAWGPCLSVLGIFDPIDGISFIWTGAI